MEPVIVDLNNRDVYFQRQNRSGLYNKSAILALSLLIVALMLASLYGLQWASQRGLTLGYPQPRIHLSSSNPSRAILGQNVHFITDVAGRDLTYYWNMGDQSGPITTYDAYHAYHSNGNFTVSVTVTDPLGHSSSDSMTIAIFPPPPVANFTYNAYYYNSSYIYFDASNSSADPSTSIASYNWDFGDGNTDNISYYQESHAYNYSGTYTVRLIVIDATGQASAPFTQTVVIP